MLVSPHLQLEIVEARAFGADRREANTLKEYIALQEKYHERIQSSREPELRERARENCSNTKASFLYMCFFC